MSDSSVAPVNLFVTPGENIQNVRATGPAAAEEPGLSFEDVPALAKVREEQRADKKRTKDASEQDVATPCASEQTNPTQIEKPESGVSNHKGESVARNKKAHSSERGAETVARDTKGAGAVVAVGTTVQIAKGQAKSDGHVEGADSQNQGPLPGKMGSSQPQRSNRPQAASNPESPALPSHTTLSRGMPMAGPSQKGGSDVAVKATVEVTHGQSIPGKAVVSATSEKAPEGIRDSPAGKSQTGVPKGSTPDTPQVDGRGNSEKAAATVQVSQALAAAKPQAVSTEKQPDRAVTKADADPNVAAQDAEKANRNPSTIRPESRNLEGHRDREAVAVSSEKSEQAAVGQGQGKEGNLPGSKDGPGQQVEVSVTNSNEIATSSSRASSQASNTTNFDAPGLKSPSQSVSDQILDSVRATLAAGQRQVMVRLNPPELGAVSVRFQEQAGEIRAVLEVARSETRQEVERAIPEVLRTLQESGVQIRRVEVILSEQSGRDLGQSRWTSGQQDGGTQQQNPQQHGDNPSGPWRTAWGPQGQSLHSGPSSEEADPQTLTGAGRINMLM